MQDYAAILKAAEAEADLVLWDGGNNDLPFYKPDLWLCIADPLRPGHEVTLCYMLLLLLLSCACALSGGGDHGVGFYITRPVDVCRKERCAHQTCNDFAKVPAAAAAAAAAARCATTLVTSTSAVLTSS
jgi:hypothetical protein